MIVPILGGGYALDGTRVRQLGHLNGVGSYLDGTSYEDSGRSDVFPVPGKLRNWRVRLQTAPGAGQAWTVKLRKNLVDTAVSITITDANQYGDDVVNELSVSPGDFVGLHATKTGAPVTSRVGHAVDFIPSSPYDQYSLLLGNPQTGPQADPGSYFPIICGLARNNISWSTYSVIMPTSGTIKYLYARLGLAQSHPAYYRVVVNGVDTDILATIPTGQLAGNDTTHSVHVGVGDRVSMRVYGGLFSGASYNRFGVGFLPDIYGETVTNMVPQILASNGQRWQWVQGYNFDTDSWTFPETNREQLAAYMAVSKLLVVFSGPGSTRRITLKDDAALTALTVLVTNPATQGQDLANVVQVAGGSVIKYQHDYTSGGDTVVRCSAVLQGMGGPVDTYDATDTKYTQAQGNGHLLDATNIDEIGFDWGVASGVYTDQVTQLGTFYPGNFSLIMSPLSPSTVYYYRAKAHSTVSGWLYGQERTFTTLPPLPEARTDPPSNASSNSIDAVGNIVSTGGDATCDKRGFVYGLISEPDPGDVAPDASGYDSHDEETGSFGTGSFTLTISSLTASRVYYLRAYTHNSYGYHYSSEMAVLTSGTVNILYPESNVSVGIRFDSSPGGGYPNPFAGTIAHYILCRNLDSEFIPGGIWGYLSGNFVYERNYFNDNFYTDLYGLSNAFRRAEGIVKIKWKARVLRNSYPYGKYKRVFRTHATDYESAAYDVSYGGAAVCQIFYTNPFSGAAWTLAELDDLIAGVSLGQEGGYGITACDLVLVYALWANASVVTDVPSRLTGTTARLFGHVNEDEAETCQVYFQWGETIAYGNATPQQIKALGDNFTDTISGLDPTKVYHARAAIVTACGETFYGNDVFVGLIGGGSHRADILVKDNFV